MSHFDHWRRSNRAWPLALAGSIGCGGAATASPEVTSNQGGGTFASSRLTTSLDGPHPRVEDGVAVRELASVYATEDGPREIVVAELGARDVDGLGRVALLELRAGAGYSECAVGIQRDGAWYLAPSFLCMRINSDGEVGIKDVAIEPLDRRAHIKLTIWEDLGDGLVLGNRSVDDANMYVIDCGLDEGTLDCQQPKGLSWDEEGW